MKFPLPRIIDSSLCLGCGLCESVSKGKYKMQIADNGFIIPIKCGEDFSSDEAKYLKENCPAINLHCVKPINSEFGNILSAIESHATDKTIRYAGSSGGAITAICTSLLNNTAVDGILQVGKCNNHYMYNELRLSTTPDEILACASSRYSPVPTFKDIFSILDSNPGKKFAFVGKPCDIMTMRRIVETHEKYTGQIPFFLSIACAGMPSYNATTKLICRGNETAAPIDVRYRGEGWPGDFRVKYDDGTEFRCDYTKSWGEVLGRNLNFRCKICPDGLGDMADITVGDSWHTKDGYPDFSESDGRSFILVRTPAGAKAVDIATNSEAIESSALDIAILPKIHAYQYMKLQTAYYKLLGARICTRGLIKVDSTYSSKIPFLKGLRITAGTIKRYMK